MTGFAATAGPYFSWWETNSCCELKLSYIFTASLDILGPSPRHQQPCCHRLVFTSNSHALSGVKYFVFSLFVFFFRFRAEIFVIGFSCKTWKSSSIISFYIRSFLL